MARCPADAGKSETDNTDEGSTILKILLQKLENDTELSEIEKKLIKPLEKKVTQKLIVTAMMQGRSQEMLTEALKKWYEYTYLFDI